MTSNRTPGKTWIAPQAATESVDDSKRVRFKDRGTDESEWRGNTNAFDPDTQRLRKLQNPALAIAEDVPNGEGKIQANRDGLKKGYDPYESGRLAKDIGARRRNLRRLGEWLTLRMQAKKNKQSDE